MVRAIQMPRVNLLVADDVGLGKTIEAGMVALELIIRHRTRKILIVCPASLQVQWQEQMRDKFGLDFRIVNSTMMGMLRRSRGIHVNPWNHFPRLITSIDFLKRERPLRLFRELLPGPDEPAFPRKFDLLIVDEAHNCAPSGRGRYATDSMRTQALRLLVPHFEHKLFLTATPHNGYPESFSALLELLDNQRFARSTPPDRKQLNAVMVRRMKSELPPKWDGSPRFPKRVLDPIEVPYTDEERAVHAALRQYAELRVKRSQDNAEKLATEFVLKTLKKRLFSSPAAFLTTLDQHEKSLRQAKRGKAVRKPSIGILKQELDRIDEDYADDTEYDEATTDAVDAASLLFSEPSDERTGPVEADAAVGGKGVGPTRLEGEVPDRLAQHAHSPRQEMGPRTGHPLHRIPGHAELAEGSPRPARLHQRRPAADHVRRHGPGRAGRCQSRLPVGSRSQPGPHPARHRRRRRRLEPPEPLLSAHPLRNPVEPEPAGATQRAHRPSRAKGLPCANGERQVFVYHFVGQGYKQRQQSALSSRASDLDADLEFLMRVAQKVETIREDLGSYGTVLADDVEQAMLGRGYSMPGVSRADTKVEPVRKMLKFERDLAKQIKRTCSSNIGKRSGNFGCRRRISARWSRSVWRWPSSRP